MINDTILTLSNLSRMWERVARFNVCPEKYPEWSHEHLAILGKDMTNAPLHEVFQLSREHLQKCVLGYLEIMREIPWPEDIFPDQGFGREQMEGMD